MEFHYRSGLADISNLSQILLRVSARPRANPRRNSGVALSSMTRCASSSISSKHLFSYFHVVVLRYRKYTPDSCRSSLGIDKLNNIFFHYFTRCHIIIKYSDMCMCDKYSFQSFDFLETPFTCNGSFRKGAKGD